MIVCGAEDGSASASTGGSGNFAGDDSSAVTFAERGGEGPSSGSGSKRFSPRPRRQRQKGHRPAGASAGRMDSQAGQRSTSIMMFYRQRPECLSRSLELFSTARN